MVSTPNVIPSTYENVTQSDEFTINSRGQRIHVRTNWPNTNPSAAVLFLHGYGAHGNRPPIRYIAETMNRSNVAFISLDFHGHGYSEGTRGLVMHFDDLIDDVITTILALFSEQTGCVHHKLCRIPFFLMGHSMGGGVAIAVEQMLQPTCILPTKYTKHQALFNNTIVPLFQGLFLVCPVVNVTNIPRIVTKVLLGTLTRVLAEHCIPKWLFDDHFSDNWNDDKYRAYVVADRFPQNPSGLSYGGNMRFATMNSIIELSHHNQRIMYTVASPFLIFHDPTDTIVPIGGSYELLNSALTLKKVVEITNGQHDIIANQTQYLANELVTATFSLINYKLYE